MTRDQATQAIAEGLEAIHAAYWAVCDAEGQAIDPAALLAPNEVLDDAFDIALGVEVFAEDKGIYYLLGRGAGAVLTPNLFSVRLWCGVGACRSRCPRRGGFSSPRPEFLDAMKGDRGGAGSPFSHARDDSGAT